MFIGVMMSVERGAMVSLGGKCSSLIHERPARHERRDAHAHALARTCDPTRVTRRRPHRPIQYTNDCDLILLHDNIKKSIGVVKWDTRYVVPTFPCLNTCVT